MLASSQETNLSEMVKIYNVHWEVWPEYTLDHGNLRQIGVEVGLAGSHTSDPKHVDPTCPRCHEVRLALSEIADMIVERRAGNITTRPCWRTRAPDHSLILDARTGFRPLVSFSIVLQKQRLDEQFNQDDTAAFSCSRMILQSSGFGTCETSTANPPAVPNLTERPRWKEQKPKCLRLHGPFVCSGPGGINETSHFDRGIHYRPSLCDGRRHPKGVRRLPQCAALAGSFPPRR